ncbi:hypothetical protein [Streptomyces amritsarensis]|uniref:hypothetical protein n=1 Tax=Streptomyces amritsarensis TaxID=681158 RepID=UPI0036749205
MKQFPGWRLVGCVGTEHGGEAFRVEQQVLRMFRREGFKPYFSKEDGVGSPTESLAPGVVSPEDLLALVEAVAGGRIVRLAA